MYRSVGVSRSEDASCESADGHVCRSGYTSLQEPRSEHLRKYRNFTQNLSGQKAKRDEK